MAARKRKSTRRVRSDAGRPQRPAGWWKEPFIEALATSGNITVAARSVPVDRRTVQRAYKEDPDFAAAWDDAKDNAVDLLVAEARRRAVVGVDKPVIHQGQLMYRQGPDGQLLLDREGNPIPLVIKQYSDTLLIFLLKGALPATYRDNVRVDHSGEVKGGVNVPRDVTFRFIRSNRHPDGPIEESEEIVKAVTEPE